MGTDLSALIELSARVSGSKEIENLIQKITLLIEENKKNTTLLHLRAELYVKLQQHHKAINDYNLILSKNETDKKAQVQLEMLSTILRYNNTDIYASPNTNMDPWME